VSWYAIHTKPQQEAIATRDLRRLGIEVFFPTQRIRRHTKRAGTLVPRWISRPYFPRWIFVDASAESLWRVRRVAAVAGIAGAGPEAPIAIPDAVMQVIMAGANAEGVMGSRDEVSRKRFETAAKVLVTDGALKGAIGSILADNGGDMISVLIGMLGGTRTIKVRAEQLQLAAQVA
jgi:transcription antitermination factor NusG